MGNNARSYPHMHGNGDVAVSRYVVLYFAQACWVVLGAYLFANAYWPSSCRPDGFLKVYECSLHLADQRGWVESSLMTWLWSTPILVALEALRHYDRITENRRRRSIKP